MASNQQAMPRHFQTLRQRERIPRRAEAIVPNENVLLAIGVLSNGASGRAKLRVKQER